MYKTQLQVSINGGRYIELFKSLDEKVTITFSPIPETQDHQLRIVDRDGNYVEFKCISLPQNKPE
jgi:hypothetical protein